MCIFGGNKTKQKRCVHLFPSPHLWKATLNLNPLHLGLDPALTRDSAAPVTDLWLAWHRPSALPKPCVGCEKAAEWTSHFTFIVNLFTPDWAALNSPPGPICLGATLHDRHWKTWNAPRHRSRLFVIKWNIKPLEAPSVMAPQRPLHQLSRACQVAASPIFYSHVKADIGIIWRKRRRQTKRLQFRVMCGAKLLPPGPRLAAVKLD